MGAGGQVLRRGVATWAHGARPHSAAAASYDRPWVSLFPTCIGTGRVGIGDRQ